MANFGLLPTAIAPVTFRQVSAIATDMDGTLTLAGKFTSQVLQAFEQLAAANIPVLLVTGRSAGWVSGLVHYLPVWGAIAENGGVFYANDQAEAMLLSPIADLSQHRQQLAAVFERLRTEFPQLQTSIDNPFRLTDWTFDVQALQQTEVEQIRDRCLAWGWGFTYSTVQGHIKLPKQEKAIGLLQVLQQKLLNVRSEQVLTVGDSPNDESLFDARLFPLAVGVANVRDYGDRLNHFPTYVTTAAEAEGFIELVHLLLAARSA